MVESLHQEHYATLVRIAWAIIRDEGLARDATQETFALFSLRLQKEQNEVGEAHQDSRGSSSLNNHVGWLVKTVQFQAKNLRRKEERRRRLLAQKFDSLPFPKLLDEDLPERKVLQEEQSQSLSRAIEELPSNQRCVLLKRLLEMKTFAEIADEENEALGTVLSRMRLALKKLRSEVSRQNENDD